MPSKPENYAIITRINEERPYNKLGEPVSFDTSSYDRPKFPARAVVTAGMPYGNKGLHFGHIGGVFVPADVFARFLRDRIGEENVLFICGTDCYGSPIEEGFRQAVRDKGFSGTISDFVMENHNAQAATLKSYNISLDIYEGSALGKCKENHDFITDLVVQRLYDNGYLHKVTTAQFFDEETNSFLNGRQVLGRCPVPDCKSEQAYADECDLGHQYMPADLIDPISALSNKPPVTRDVTNWYFDLPGFRDFLKEHVRHMQNDTDTRSVVSTTIDEFLVHPSIYVKDEFSDEYDKVISILPNHRFFPAEAGKTSFELSFADLDDRDKARAVFDANKIRYRTGKTLVPFRITGNIKWGVAAPVIENFEGLTVWVWPESLWAPITFSKTCLENKGVGVETLNPSRSWTTDRTWRDFWCSDDAIAYQFIGQDNIYFYGVAQTAMWEALANRDPEVHIDEPLNMKQSQLVANYHLLFLDKKASSSGKVKPPSGAEMLDYYTVEQLRAHFLALGLSLKPVSFQPKAFNPLAKPNDADPVLKEGLLLTNVFNRLARSCFYAAQKDNGGLMPVGAPSPEILEAAHATILEYERLMHRQEFHSVMQLVSEYIRQANKLWSDAIKEAGEDHDAKVVVLKNAFYLLKVCAQLMHPVVPAGTEMIFEYLNLAVDAKKFFSWEYVFDGYEVFVTDEEIQRGGHPVKELPPRTDFFARHPSQY